MQTLKKWFIGICILLGMVLFCGFVATTFPGPDLNDGGNKNSNSSIIDEIPDGGNDNTGDGSGTETPGNGNDNTGDSSGTETPDSGAIIEFVVANEDGELVNVGLSSYLWNMDLANGLSPTYNGKNIFPSISESNSDTWAEYDDVITSTEFTIYESGELFVPAATAGGVEYSIVSSVESITLNDGDVYTVQILAENWGGPDGERDSANIQINYVGSGEVEKAETITFTIDDTTYQAEEGMTWGEWVNSVYDNNSEYNNNVGFIHYEDTKYFIHMNEDMVYETDIIVAGMGYQLIEVNGPLPT